MKRLIRPWRAGAAAVLIACVSNSGAAQATIQVQADQPRHEIPQTLWGIFFEDINLSADGGIYPELVRNRSFEDAETLEHWTLGGPEGAVEAQIDTSHPLNPLNRRSLKIQVNGTVMLTNSGYWGMHFVKGEQYRLRLAARAEGGLAAPLQVALEAAGAEPARAQLTGLSARWKEFTAELTALATDPAGKLVLRMTGEGTLWLDMVSLLPARTWNDHGLRPDLCEMLAAMQPGFVRFPGGCWVEGDDMARMYHWKKTIGDLAHREPLWNIWGYFATHGLGYHEYLQLSEDLNAEPLFCINVGMSHRENIPMDQMGQWVQDALDALEYANGPSDSVWGGLRAQHGHPAPFRLKYLEIGNENGGPAYQERWPLFHRAIKSKYPEVQLIANVWGGYPTNPMPDIIDEHYYNNPEFFMQQASRYDTYDRRGPKVFVGEYAVTQGTGQGNLRGAIGEAAFMTGIERNADVVVMASYAPLFVNVNHRRWNPDLINFDSARVYGLPSYYVQQLFAVHRGDVTVPISVQSPEVTSTGEGGTIGVGTWATQAEFKDIRVTRGDQVLYAADLSGNATDWKYLGGGQWEVRNGVLRQTARGENIRAIVAGRSWTNYTYTLKARKLGGAEGFLILFRVGDEEAKSWWNIGGWGNTRHAIERGGILGTDAAGSIETGRWYDIRLEVHERQVRCYLDGTLIHEGRAPTVQSLYACAARARATDEVILKVVNVAPDPLETAIAFRGARAVRSPATAIVLTSDRPTDENSLETPRKVAPVSSTLEVRGGSLIHRFPGNSFTVIRTRVDGP